MAAHSQLLSPSAAHRRIACPGSARLEAGQPDRPSEYSALGSAAHHLGERCLRKGVYAETFLDRCIVSVEKGGHSMLKPGAVREDGFIVDLDMTEAVQVYLDYCWSLLAPNRTSFVEHRFTIVNEAVFGTADFVVCEMFGEIWVVDYKHGQGVSVNPVENPQGMMYALGALRASPYDHDKVNIVIVQPRSRDNWPVREWSLSVPALKQWEGDVLVPAIAACKDPNAPLHAGDHCRFCKAYPVCPEAKSTAMTVTRAIPANGGGLTVPSAELLTSSELAQVLSYKDFLTNWLKGVEDYAKQRLMDGYDVPGYKMVEAKANRKFNPLAEAQLSALLGSAAYKPGALIGIGDAETLLKRGGYDVKAIMETITIKPRGNPVLATMDDKRSAIAVGAESMFDPYQGG